METIPYLDHTIRRWQIGRSTFLAWPEAGARLMHWHHTRADGSVRDIIHWPELSETDGNLASVRGGNPILFPFNARSFCEGDIHHWRAPDGRRRAMPMHGLARQGAFALESINERGFRAVFQPTEANHASYPFDYEFSVSYRFEERRLTCTFALQNLGNTPLPWSAGHHFYFAVPWQDGTSRADYVLTRPGATTLRQTSVGSMVPGPLIPQRTSLAEPELIDTVHVELAQNRFVLTSPDNTEQLEVTLGTDDRPPADAAMVTWAADDEVPYYCIEPWMGPPNAPENKRGLAWVAPGQTGHFTVGAAIT